ncbi:MAG: CAP domain-containing protein [Pseudomonadota bacterium]
MRALIAALFLLYGLIGSATACEVRSVAAAGSLSDYVERAQACLDNSPSEFHFSDEMEGQFIRLINEERERIGLTPVAVRDTMRPAARFHSLDMGVNDFFGHVSPQGRTPAFRVAAFDRTLVTRATAENVAKIEFKRTCRTATLETIPCGPDAKPPRLAAPSDVRELHTRLMNSSVHRKNILSPNASEAAIGVAVSPEGIYVTQLFTATVGEFSEPVPVNMVAGDNFAIDIRLSGYRSTRLSLSYNDQVTVLSRKRLPKNAVEDAAIAVRGETVTFFRQDGRLNRDARFSSFFSGPRVTLVASPEDSGA